MKVVKLVIFLGAMLCGAAGYIEGADPSKPSGGVPPIFASPALSAVAKAVAVEVFACDKCTQQFKDQKGLGKHKKREHPQKCRICDKECKTDKALVDHFKEKHHEEKPFQCGECKRGFARNEVLKAHMALKHASKKPEKFKCDFCKNAYIHDRDLLRHIKAEHPKEKPYQCEICQTGCSTKKDLKKHKLAHMPTHTDTGEKKFKCGRCGKGFVKNGNLNHHESICKGKKSDDSSAVLTSSQSYALLSSSSMPTSSTSSSLSMPYGPGLGQMYQKPHFPVTISGSMPAPSSSVMPTSSLMLTLPEFPTSSALASSPPTEFMQQLSMSLPAAPSSLMHVSANPLGYPITQVSCLMPKKSFKTPEPYVTCHFCGDSCREDFLNDHIESKHSLPTPLSSSDRSGSSLISSTTPFASPALPSPSIPVLQQYHTPFGAPFEFTSAPDGSEYEQAPQEDPFALPALPVSGDIPVQDQIDEFVFALGTGDPGLFAPDGRLWSDYLAAPSSELGMFSEGEPRPDESGSGTAPRGTKRLLDPDPAQEGFLKRPKTDS